MAYNGPGTAQESNQSVGGAHGPAAGLSHLSALGVESVTIYQHGNALSRTGSFSLARSCRFCCDAYYRYQVFDMRILLVLQLLLWCAFGLGANESYAVKWLKKGAMYAKTPLGFVLRFDWRKPHPLALSIPVVNRAFIHASIHVPLAPNGLQPTLQGADLLLLRFNWKIGNLLDPLTTIGVKEVEGLMALIEVRGMRPHE